MEKSTGENSGTHGQKTRAREMTKRISFQRILIEVG